MNLQYDLYFYLFSSAKPNKHIQVLHVQMLSYMAFLLL